MNNIIDYRNNSADLNESFIEHAHKTVIGEQNANLAHFSVEPSGQKDYDIYLMTGNNTKGSDKK